MAIAIKAAALKWKSEIHYWLGLEIKPSQTPVEICNKLLVKLGLKAEAIARPGTVGKRDLIYQVSGMANPFRDCLLAAERRRLTEASPDFDESSVVDGLEMLRDRIGLTKLVHCIISGWQWCKHDLKLYADRARELAPEIKVAFHFTISNKVSNVQVVHQLLSHLGVVLDRRWS